MPSFPNGKLSPARDKHRGLDSLLPTITIGAYFFRVQDVTRILERVQQGDAGASEELLPLVYDELRQLAAHKMNGECLGHTLQPTALVHEAWLRLGADAQPQWQKRAHFFSAAAEAMRRILIERARRRLTTKRGGGAGHVQFDEVEIAIPVQNDDSLLALNEALEEFATIDPQKAALVKLRYFVGMDYQEAAKTLGIAVPTAKRWWAYARAWLAVQMRTTPPE